MPDPDTRLREHVERIIANWPAPSDEKIERIAALLRADTRSGAT
jgi:hypothetical protein